VGITRGAGRGIGGGMSGCGGRVRVEASVVMPELGAAVGVVRAAL
jgi:hypothetical protein